MENIEKNIQLFAISSEETNSSLKSDAGNRATIYVKFTERDLTEDNIKNNTTTIDLEGTYTQNTGSWAQISSPMFYLEWWDNKRNEWTEISKLNVTAMNRYEVKSLNGTIDVPHNDDGSLSGQARVRWVYTAGSTLVPRSGDATTQITQLTTVPRKNTIVSYNANIGYDCAIDISKKTSISTTTITYFINGKEIGVAIPNTSADGRVWWHVPTSFYDYLSATDKYIDVTLRASTFINNQGIDYFDYPIKVYVYENDNLPILSLEAKDVNEKTIFLTQDDKKIILNASNVQCNYSAEAQNGANIKSAFLNGSALPINSSAISGAYYIPKPTTNVFKLSATDTRDFENSDTDTLEYIPYFAPTLTALIERNTATDGLVNVDFQGTFFNETFPNGTNNVDNFEIKYCYKGKGENDYTDWVTLEYDVSENSFSGYTQLEEINYQNAYSFKISVKDTLNDLGIIVYTQDIPKGRPSPWFDEENFYVDGDYYIRNKTTGKWEKLFKKSFAQMFTEGYLTANGDYVSSWATVGNFEFGDFKCQPIQKRIYVPKGSAEYVRIFMHLAGHSSASISLVLYDEKGETIFLDNYIVQPGGNGYFSQSLFERVFKVDTTKDLYIGIKSSGYNGSTFKMNEGFSQWATFIGVEKISRW